MKYKTLNVNLQHVYYIFWCFTESVLQQSTCLFFFFFWNSSGQELTETVCDKCYKVDFVWLLDVHTNTTHGCLLTLIFHVAASSVFISIANPTHFFAMVTFLFAQWLEISDGCLVFQTLINVVMCILKNYSRV